MALRIKKGPPWLGIALAVLAVATAAVIRAGLLASLGTRAQYVTFFPAVMIAALYGGLYAGLLATVLSAGAVLTFWMETPSLSWMGRNPPDLLGMGVFLASGVMIASICEAMHRAQIRAVAAEAQAQATEERRRAEEVVRKAYQRLNLHVENSPLAVVEWDSDFHITRWAGEAPNVFGWTVDEVMGKRIDELPWAFEKEIPLSSQVMADMLSDKSPSHISHCRSVRKDGSVIHCEWYNTAISDASGRLVSVLSQILDVTERKNAEDALRQSEVFVRSVLNSLFAFVGVLKPDGTLIEANRAALEAAGLEPQDVLGKRFDQTFWWSWSPEVQARLLDAIARGARGESSRFDVTVRLNHQRLVPIDFMLSPMRDGAGNVTYLIPSAIPIEERKQMEEALRLAKDDLEKRVKDRTAELSQTVETLGKEVSRRILAEQDLRERSEQLRFLASQLTMAEQRERKRLAGILHDHLQQLLVGAKFSILSLRKAKEEKIAPALMELETILDSSIETTRSLTAELSPPVLRDGGLLPALEWLARWMKEKHGLAVELSVPQNANIQREELKVLLFEAVRELLFNVVKHSGVQAARIQVNRLGTNLDVVVSDEGVGFNPASILAGPLSAGGFGLFSIRERIHLMGGSMEIGSAKGKGASFRLTVQAG
jgi:PAS domain S-box-containing protein